MTAKNILGKLCLLGFLAVATQSCKKENSIDNNNVIQRPYALYAIDGSGTVLKSNNGEQYQTIFPGDGLPVRALITSKQNILLVKEQSVFMSDNNGKSFNPTKLSVVSVPTGIKWSNFILDVPSFNHVYIANYIAGPSVGNVSVSPSNGEYYDADTNWTDIDVAFSVASFTQLQNGTVFGYSISGSKNSISKLYYKEAADKKWTPQVTDLPNPYNFFLSNHGNNLIVTDYDGVKGVMYSNDMGKTFTAYAGIPTGKILYATKSAYGELFVGTEVGIYWYNGSSFQAINSGLDANTKVYSIVGKDNYYKNEILKKFIYIATNTGVYRSENLGKSWIKVKSGIHTLVY